MLPSSSLLCTICGTSNVLDAAFCECCRASLLLSAYLASRVPFYNRYHLIEKLGEGGFGAVYKASDTLRGDQLVAIKEIGLRGLAPEAMAEAIDTFHREVDVLARLEHPALPRLHDYIRKSEQWYLVLDFIEGETLEEYQNKAPNKHLVLSEVFSIGLQLCDVLEYLHTHQPPIVFRDLKPANIMRSPDGKITLIDFGIARFFKPGQSKDTIPLGSPGYAAPEQYGRAQTTPGADIYSLGAVLHQLLTGKDPSESPLRFARLQGTMTASRADPGSLTSSMVDVMMNNLGLLINRMLEIERNKRPASVAQIKQELYYLAATWAEIVRDYLRPHVPRASLPMPAMDSERGRMLPKEQEKSPGMGG
jgi:eukaryotic-like serine/threonine-protein kinase